MSVFYQSIKARQRPRGLGADPDGRAMLVFNIDVRKRPSTTFLEELVKILTTAGVGTFNTNIFAGEAARIPSGDSPGPFLLLVDTSSLSDHETHNALPGGSYEQPSASVTVIARTYVAARTMALAAHGALRVVRNQDVTYP
jgi:hypothetical protein